MQFILETYVVMKRAVQQTSKFNVSDLYCTLCTVQYEKNKFEQGKFANTFRPTCKEKLNAKNTAFSKLLLKSEIMGRTD